MTIMPQENTGSSPWTESMRRGAFEEAWIFSDAMLRSGLNRDYLHLPRHYQCIWDGTPLHGKRVLIRCYHGLGDTIQFIRYAPMVSAIAAHVTVWAQPAMLPLLQTVRGIDALLPLHDGAPETAYDVDAEIMELPHVFRTTLATIPAETPYLHVPPLPVEGGDDRLAVGLVWKGGDWDAARDIPFSLLKPLFALDAVRFFIVQGDAMAAGWECGFGTWPGNLELWDYARLLRSLDLVITIDSMPTHLAGALHVPVWTLLQANADWRWMSQRSSSPWYPSMQLFRQDHPGRWEPVIRRVAGALKERVLQRASTITLPAGGNV